MRFTDKFFEFPIRIYDGQTISEALEEGPQEDPLWILGDIKIPAEKVASLKWHSYFKEENGVKGAIEREEKRPGSGLPHTMVMLESGHEYVCPLNKSRFEDELNNFVEKMEANLRKIYVATEDKAGTGTDRESA